MLGLVFLKNAWVCEDAFINFRSLDQLFAGNGPNWNGDVRAQVYTNMLQVGFNMDIPLYYGEVKLGEMPA